MLLADFFRPPSESIDKRLSLAVSPPSLGALLARLNSKEFSTADLKGLLMARMHTPTTKGGKLALAQQLKTVLVGGPAPLMLTN